MIRSISRRLVWQVLLISVVVACLAAAYQLHAAYRSGQEDLHAYLERISATHVPALSASVWQLDEGQIRHLLAGIARYPDVSQVTIEGDLPFQVEPVKGPVKPGWSAPLEVREDESPWTAAELKAVRAELDSDIAQLRRDLEQAESEIVDLMRDSGDGAGDDQADAGAKTYEREQELALAENAREMLAQNEHALARLEDGTYGVCESCGQPIGKLRLQAAPRATLCMPCKKKQERR